MKQSSGGRHLQEQPAPKKTGGKSRKIVLFIILGIVLALIITGVILFKHMYNLMDTSGAVTTAVATATPSVEAAATEEPIEEETPSPSPEPLTEEEIALQEELALQSSLQENAEEIMYSDDVYNILLLGADGYSTAENLERSDAMILLSINKETKTMWLTSLMRDTQVTIPGYGIGHLNWATSWRDVDLLIETIEYEGNFAIHIDNWACVNFISFAQIASQLGPITVRVSAQEAADMNKMIRQVCQMIDLQNEGTKSGSTPRCYFPTDTTGMELDENGRYEITISDGPQILGFCRERHINGDTGRSAHQREALVKMWDNMKKMSLKELYKLAESMMSIISTDMTEGQCASLLLQSAGLMKYDIQAQQCPTPGAFCKTRDDGGLSIYNADFAANRDFLRATIYGDVTEPIYSSWTGNTVCIWAPEEE